ncbi:MAG: ABC transporter permease [Thermodesulfobacteriota bacterium]
MKTSLYGLYTLFRKEVIRFAKVWIQTLVSPLVTVLLYLLIFSYVLAGRVDTFTGVSYGEFLIPGLIMMAIIQNSFANSSSSLIQSKINGNIIFILLTPISPLEFFLAYAGAAVVRGVMVGCAIFVVTTLFIAMPVHSILIILLFGLIASALMSTFGIIAGLWSERFDQMSAFTNFIIVPMSFLSGVFYSVRSLPLFWRKVSHLNPFFYMIDGFRYGFFGESDVSPLFSFAFITVVLLALVALTVTLLHRGYKLRG